MVIMMTVRKIFCVTEANIPVSVNIIGDGVDGVMYFSNFVSGEPDKLLFDILVMFIEWNGLIITLTVV